MENAQKTKKTACAGGEISRYMKLKSSLSAKSGMEVLLANFE